MGLVLCIPQQPLPDLHKSQPQNLPKLGDVRLFLLADEGDRHARPACTPGSPTAVRIVIELIRQLVMEDKGEALHIDSPRRDIGRDQELEASFAKGAQHFVPLCLHQITLQNAQAMPALCQFLK